MTRFLNIIALGAVLALVLAMPVRAEEEEAAPAKSEASKEAPAADAKKAEGGGEEGGGAKKGKEPADVSGGRFAGDPVFIHLAPLVLPVISNKGAEQIVTIQITIEINDFDVGDDIHTNMPRVRDALMRALYGGLGNGNLRDGNLVDIDRIKAKTMTSLNDLLGAGKVKDVLIEGVSQRMF